MIYPLMLVVLGLWALVALRDRHLTEPVRIFLGCLVLAVLAETALLGILRSYDWHMGLLPDARADRAATTLIVAALDPLMGVLFARYCRRRTVGKALAAAALLGAFEWWMVTQGYVVYRRFWHPLLTASIFCAYFLLVWWATAGTVRIPLWVDTLGMAFCLGVLSDVLLSGVFGLWQYQANGSGGPWEDGRTLSLLLHELLFCPLATAVAVAPLRKRAVWAAGAIVALFVAEGAAWSYGLLTYHGWSVGLSVLRWAAVVGITVLYAAWMRRAPMGAWSRAE